MCTQELRIAVIKSIFMGYYIFLLEMIADMRKTPKKNAFPYPTFFQTSNSNFFYQIVFPFYIKAFTLKTSTLNIIIFSLMEETKVICLEHILKIRCR